MVTLIGFMRELVLYPVSVYVAYAVAVQQEYAQDLFDAFKQCCQVWGFPPDLRNFTLVLGNSVCVWGILALALNILCFFIYVGF